MIKRRSLFSVMALLIFCLLLSACGDGKALLPVDPDSNEAVVFEVEKGSNLTKVAKQLEEENLIRSNRAFLNYAKQQDMTNIKAGKYHISQSMSAEEILRDLVDGNDYRGEKIIIPEGFELSQIANRLEENGVVSKEEFLEETSMVEKYRQRYEFLSEVEQPNLEGYLYPDTYFFEKDSSAELVVSEMLDTFSKIYEEELKPLIGSDTLNIAEAVILGSIIEKEAVLEEDRPLISSVFHNRLKKNMKLQSDATVQYALDERTKRVLYKDLEVESPYNTYKVYGLPIGAIANPRTSSIVAALEPEETDYLFFLTKSDGSGEQVYSKTFEEHKVNKKKYIH
ncbi:endolytic transglycosylase MltG [Filifactor villosus]|uniref:Endolytic murein transglycosylase n=1 Tax=Filifactor villosus TaxID=29374 RepID=A0ABV9QIG9_9FIRM